MRYVVLTMAMLFVVGLGYLAVADIAKNGVTGLGVVGLLLAGVVGIGIVGAFVGPRRR